MNEYDFYQRLRRRTREWTETPQGKNFEWTEYLLLAPDLFHLLWKVAGDHRVPVKDKSRLALGVAYFISPMDFLPEMILGPAAFVDDVALAAYLLNRLLNHGDPQILRDHWAGEDDVLLVLQRVLGAADRMVGSGLWSRIRRWI